MLLFESDKVLDVGHIENVFTEEECNRIITYGNQLPSQEGTTNAVNNVDPKTRSSKVSWILPNPEIHWLYQKLGDIIISMNSEGYNFDLYGFTEALQFTTYEPPGDHYVFHIDKANRGPVRKLSFVLQLTDPNEYEGGDLVYKIQDEDAKVPKSQGTICVFPSYILHKVTPVTKGKRQTLVGWLGGPNFK